jgi:hypothetical protein
MKQKLSYEERISTLEKEYDSLLEGTMDDVGLDAVRIKDALKGQLTLELVWNSILAKTKTLKEELEYQVEVAYSASIEKELKNSYRSTSISEAREFAKCNETYREYRKHLLNATGLYEDCKSAVETVTSRRYILNNLTNLVVSGSENHLL